MASSIKASKLTSDSVVRSTNPSANAAIIGTSWGSVSAAGR